MADLVLGLAKSVVEGTLSKAAAAIEAETTLRQGAKRNLVFITGEFQMMQSFLQVANADRVENPVVMTWVRQIRELAYDVEDCVEFVIHLDTKSSWVWCRRLIPSCCMASALPLDVATQELEELKARVEEVSRRNHNYNLISDTGSKPFVVQHQLPATASNSMLINISADHSAYALDKERSKCEEETGKRTLQNCENEAADQKQTSQFEASEWIVNSEKVLKGKQKEATEWIVNNKLVGRDTEMNDLRCYTTDLVFKDCQFMSVWGIAGVGKSFLLKHLFCERITKPGGCAFGKYGWVDVSHPFKLEDFSRSLILNFQSESLETKETACSGTTVRGNTIAACQAILKNYKCLVVIDGLKSTEDWDLIQADLLSGSSNNCIITNATERSIATHCSEDKGVVFNVKGLELDVANELLKTKVSAAGYPLPPGLSADERLEIEELVSKCGGLPRVIVEIAFSLGRKSVKKMQLVRAVSNNFIHELENNREFDKLQHVFSWVRSYFRNCPDFLKPCIFYLSIFPRDFSLRRRRLLRRWIAEGYSRDNHEEFAELSSEKQFSGLLELSLIQQQPQKVGEAGKTLYQVNGFVREYIVSKRMEENLVFELGESSTITTQRTGRHLVILEGWKRDRIVFESMDFCRLRSLTVFGEWESFFISNSMSLLRVLDLENASELTEEDVKKVVKLLLRLKFLSLRGHREIYHLPGSLHKLSLLETLDVRDTSITSMPEKVTELQLLQYIRAGSTTVLQPHCSEATDVPAPDPPSSRSNVTTEPVASSSNGPAAADIPAPASCCRFCRCQRPTVGVELPIGTGRLTALHTLGVVDIAASGANSIVREIKQLTQLRKLGVCGINRKNSNKFFAAIKGHVHLESMSLQFDKDNSSQPCCCFSKDSTNNRDAFDGMLSLPCGNLLSLKLYGLEDNLPRWENDMLRKLTKLELEMASLTRDGICFLAKLPGLRILRLKQLQDGQLHFLVIVHNVEDSSYEKLKVLEIGSISAKVSVTFGSKTMKQLELLKVDCPSASSFQFSDLKNLRKLKEVRLVKGDHHKTQEGRLMQQLNEKSNQVKLVVLVEPPHSS